MLLVLQVPDEIVITFFTAVVLGQSTAIVVLWRRVIELERAHRDLKSQ